MIRSTTRFDSERAERYLVQLCKHFAHKVPASYESAGDGPAQDRMEGKVDFPWGVCRMSATGDGLAIICEAADAESLKRVEYVVADHVERFAWREKPRIDWQPA